MLLLKFKVANPAQHGLVLLLLLAVVASAGLLLLLLEGGAAAAVTTGSCWPNISPKATNKHNSLEIISLAIIVYPNGA